jgi:hypothetical protein
MKVFISQSKPRSLELAEALQSLIRMVVHGTEPWVSESAIDKGARWTAEVASTLKDVDAGIVVLTPENLDERWLLFEAGALSIKAAGRLWTYLLDVEHRDVQQPLSDFLHTRAEKAETLKMLMSIHNSMVAAQEKTNSADDVERAFDALWDKELGSKIAELRARGPDAPRPKRKAEDVLSEILEQVRRTAHNTNSSSWRLEQAYTVLAEIYAKVGGTASFEELLAREVLPASLKAVLGEEGFSLHDVASLHNRAVLKRNQTAVGPESSSRTPNRRSMEDDPPK